MKFEHFHYLFEIDRYQSISSAAKALQIKQSSLRSIVKVMEREFGFTIFQRSTDGVTPTAKGEQLIALVREIDIRYEKLMSLKKHDEHSARRVKVLLCPSINLGLSVPLASQYYQYNLPGNVIFEERQRSEIAPCILENAANLGVTYLTKDDIRKLLLLPEIEVHVLAEDRRYLLVSKDHELAKTDTISADDIQDMDIATVTGFGSKTRQNLGTENNRFFAYPNIALMKRAIVENKMVGVLFGYAIAQDEPLNASDYRVIPFTTDAAPFNVCLLQRRVEELRHQERILSHCIIEHFKEFSITPLSEKAGKE